MKFSLPEKLIEYSNLIKETIISLGGVLEQRDDTTKHAKKLACRVSGDSYDLDEEVVKEINAAIFTELSAEVIQNIIYETRKIGQLSDTWKGFSKWNDGGSLSAAKLLVEMIEQHADSLASECLIIVSPTALCMLQLTDAFVAIPLVVIEHPIVGKVGEHTIVVDPYGLDIEPVLILAPEWVTVDTKGEVSVSEVLTDPNSLDNYYSFNSSFNPQLDASKIRKINVSFNDIVFSL